MLPQVSVTQARTAWGIQGGRRGPQVARSVVGYPRNGRFGVACPQVIEGSGMVGPGETLESLWIPHAIRAWCHPTVI
jgi:hypothetical protein